MTRRIPAHPPVVLFAANSPWNLLNFRGPIIAGLKEQGFRIAAAVPDDNAVALLRKIDVEVEFVEIDARGVSPLNDIRLLLNYYEIVRRVSPAVFLPFTAKPNIYGSIAARACGVPVVNTITGLGTGYLSGRILQSTISLLYRAGLRRSQRVFFHNKDDRDLFLSRGILRHDQAAVVAGSGVDLSYFCPTRRQKASQPPIFLFVGRLLRDKGAGEFLEAAAIVKRERSARFRMLGGIENHPKAISGQLLEASARNGIVELLGTTDDVRHFIADADCVVLPSYREGLPRALLEASAMGVPVIATDVPGCRQAVDDGITGLLCKPQSASSLAEAIMTIAKMPEKERDAMGRRGRAKAERDFGHGPVVEAYLQAIRDAIPHRPE